MKIFEENYCDTSLIKDSGPLDPPPPAADILQTTLHSGEGTLCLQPVIKGMRSSFVYCKHCFHFSAEVLSDERDTSTISDPV